MSADEGKEEVSIENIDIWKRASTATHIVNHFDQDSAAEVIYFKTLMEELYLNSILSRDQGYVKGRQPFHQSPGPELIRVCNGKSIEIRSNAVNKESNDGMRCCKEKR